MLGMGVTLTFDDFKRVLKAPRPIATGCGAQFLIMPFLGWAIAHSLNLQAIKPEFAAGLILVACCPGGTASNVVCYLARANVALFATTREGRLYALRTVRRDALHLW